MRRFITLATIALIVAAVVKQRQRVSELGRQALSGRTTPDQWQRVQGLTRRVLSRGTEQTSVSVEENKAVVRREIEELFNHTGNLDVADEIYAPDYVGHEPTFGDVRGVEGAKQFAADMLQAFPDLESTIEDQIAEGDKVVTRFRTRGTHQGESEDLGPPTGNRMEITGITIERFADGKIVEDWTNFDALGLMQQLGLIPEQ
jgi:predicted ester cyclase